MQKVTTSTMDMKKHMVTKMGKAVAKNGDSKKEMVVMAEIIVNVMALISFVELIEKQKKKRLYLCIWFSNTVDDI